jgi:hypothetical protein
MGVLGLVFIGVGIHILFYFKDAVDSVIKSVRANACVNTAFQPRLIENLTSNKVLMIIKIVLLTMM